MPVTTSSEFIRVPFEAMLDRFLSVLRAEGFSPYDAQACASIFAQNSVEGVYTHGVNRFARFISYIRQGHIRVGATPSKVSGVGALEQWDGHLGPGPLNAVHATDRALLLARQHSLGCVALANTNHWMRGGYYGWYAARRGFVFIGWTNTTGNMPPWGATEPKLGNNPLVIAIPYGDEAVVLDMAMSQYSYGALDLYKSKQQPLPTPGGYDNTGRLTDDPAAIVASRRVLPIGYWKGAGLSLVLDMVSAILSGGLSTAQITSQGVERGLSQVYMAIALDHLQNFPTIQTVLQNIIDDYSAAEPVEEGQRVRFPGEKALAVASENRAHGIPVAKTVWQEIMAL